MGGPCGVRFKFKKFENVLGGGVPIVSSNFLLGNGHMGPPSPCEQLDMTENITFQQLR